MLTQLGPQKQNREWQRKSQSWVEFLSRKGGRNCFILANDKNKKYWKNLWSKLVDYSPKQDDHKQWALKHRNKPNESKSTNHKSQTMTFWTRSGNHVFPEMSAKIIDRTEKPKIALKFEKRHSAIQQIWQWITTKKKSQHHTWYNSLGEISYGHYRYNSYIRQYKLVPAVQGYPLNG